MREVLTHCATTSRLQKNIAQHVDGQVDNVVFGHGFGNSISRGGRFFKKTGESS